MIPYNRPPVVGNEINYILDAIKREKFSGDGHYTKLCHSWFENSLNVKKVLLTTSGTHALEMAALLLNIKEGDEVIMPSFTFSSTANAFALRGAKIVFIDIRPDTLNLNEEFVEKAITKKTKAIVPVHYAGISCNMDAIIQIANKYKISVVEDAAQAMLSTHNEQYLGTLGDLGCFSFHETKNFSCGEGGLILLNQEKYFQMSEIIREKGTDRSRFFRGEVDKYTWQNIGSSFLPSEIIAAFLYGQLEQSNNILKDRISSWSYYYDALSPLKFKGLLELPFVPAGCKHNGHIFYIKVKDSTTRDALAKFLKDNGILAVGHYIPLHSSPAGKKYGVFFGKDEYTTKESCRLLRLPLYYLMGSSTLLSVINKIYSFFGINN